MDWERVWEQPGLGHCREHTRASSANGVKPN